jgi:polysaccharide export outer membrane protein
LIITWQHEQNDWQGYCNSWCRAGHDMKKHLSSFAVGIAVVVICSGTIFGQLARKISDRPESFGETEYQLGPEDVIQVFVWKEDDLTTTAVIRPDGKISLPLIGEIVASKKTPNQLQQEVGEKLKAYVSKPVVTVIVKEVNSPKVSVFGEVRKPDVYKIKQRTTVLDAVAAAGGLTEFAKKNKVLVIRDDPKGPQRFMLNLDSMLEGGKAPIFYLQPGDKIYVQ